MPDNGLMQKRDAHAMDHGRPVQITESTTVVELQPSLSDIVCANKKLQIGIIVATPAFCRYQDMGLHHRGYRSKEGQRFGAHDLVRGAVCGHYRAAW